MFESQVDGLTFPMTIEGRIYAAYAQHYLLTYSRSS